ncbi:DUF3253 domain-containing protein [Xanthomonas maliensis]|nr:DUF3253 domain-containing protein [Xanthomonas maliensis]KAB7769817.1 DUF3253 domain-containing protein [Xanthomonas maliensis]
MSATTPRTSAGPDPAPATIAATIVRLLAHREAGRTACPSEVARAIADDPKRWRALMPQVRLVAATLRAQCIIVVTQRGKPVDPCTARGPIRLARGSHFPY